MQSNKTVWILVIVVVTALVWFCRGRQTSTGKAIEDGVESTRLAIAEAVLPPDNEPSKSLVIRRAMLEAREKNNREWTAANIRAYPELYLEHCSKMLTQFLGQYDDAILETKTAINIRQREIADAGERSAPLVAFLREAKKTLSDAAREFPAKVGAYTYPNAEKVRDAVRATDAKLAELENLSGEKKSQIEKLSVALDELSRGRERVRLEQANLDGRRAEVTSKSLETVVADLQTRMNELLGGLDSVPGTGESAPGAVRTDNGEKPDVNEIFTRRKID